MGLKTSQTPRELIAGIDRAFMTTGYHGNRYPRTRYLTDFLQPRWRHMSTTKAIHDQSLRATSDSGLDKSRTGILIAR